MTGTTQLQLQWLIRKNTKLVATPGTEPAGTGVVVLGPFHTDQVRRMVAEGMLEADDEICPENGYWFSMHETSEVRRFLGVDQVVLARSTDADGEATQPDLEITQPDLVMPCEEKTPPGIEPAVFASDSSNPEATAILTVRRPEPAKVPAASAKSAATRPAPAPAARPLAKPAASQERAPSAAELASRFQRVTPQSSSPYAAPTEQLESKQVLGLEKGQFWSLLIIAGIVLALLGVLWIISSLKGLSL